MEAHAIAIADPWNRRTEPRARTLKRGLIVFHDGHSVFVCTVRNLSSGGAMLLFGDPLGVPSHFDLEYGQATIGGCVRSAGETKKLLAFPSTRSTRQGRNGNA